MNRLVYVRHGLTDHNVAGVLSGQSEATLTTEGLEQAHRIHTLIDVVPDYILTSPRERAVRTAQIVMADLGIDRRELQVVDLLDERSFGQLEGTPAQHYPNELDSETQLSMWEAGAEPLSDLYHRAQLFLGLLQRAEFNGDVLAIGHGSFGRALLRAATRRPYDTPIDAIPNAVPVEVPRTHLALL